MGIGLRSRPAHEQAKLRALTVVDVYTRKALAIEMALLP